MARMLRNPLNRWLSLLGLALLTTTVGLVSGGDHSPRQAQAAVAGSVPLGDPCASYDDCQEVAGKNVQCRCTGQGSKPVCVADLQAGDDCTTLGNLSPVCETGTRCTPVEGALSHSVCLRVAKVGEDCGPSTGGCQDPAFCDSTQHCSVGQANLGETCTEHAQCKAPFICPWGRRLCTAPAKIGEACDTNSNGRSYCEAGAGCNGSKCVAKKPDGAACMFDEECRTGLCGVNGCGRGAGPRDAIPSCGI
jgi:hypothetical protein